MDAAGADAAPVDAAAPMDAAVDAMPPDMMAEGPARYPADRLVSPLTPFAVERLRSVIEAQPDRNDRIFSKIGASATVSRSYLHCFAGAHVALDGRDELAPVIDWFLDGEVDGVTPFERESESATVGWHAGRALAGDPAPVEREIAAADPRFATIQYGTNDVGIVNLDTYGDNLLTLVDRLLDTGVIPIVSTVMPRGDSAAQDAKIPRLNLAVRAVAQARQIPMVDLHLAIRDLPDRGLSADEIHPSVYRSDGARRACNFEPAGLMYGYNWRNLLTIQAFAGLVQTLIFDEPAPDPAQPRMQGDGTVEAPLLIDALPFVDARDTTEGPSDIFDDYPGCNADQDESGSEWIYRFELDRPAVVQAFVLDRGDVDIDLHLLSAPDPAACLERGHQTIEASLDAGTYYLVADTFVARAGERSGPFLIGLRAD
jgi:hypothetical protein